MPGMGTEFFAPLYALPKMEPTVSNGDGAPATAASWAEGGEEAPENEESQTTAIKKVIIEVVPSAMRRRCASGFSCNFEMKSNIEDSLR